MLYLIIIRTIIILFSLGKMTLSEGRNVLVCVIECDGDHLELVHYCFLPVKFCICADCSRVYRTRCINLFVLSFIKIKKPLTFCDLLICLGFRNRSLWGFTFKHCDSWPIGLSCKFTSALQFTSNPLQYSFLVIIAHS